MFIQAERGSKYNARPRKKGATYSNLQGVVTYIISIPNMIAYNRRVVNQVAPLHGQNELSSVIYVKVVVIGIWSG